MRVRKQWHRGSCSVTSQTTAQGKGEAHTSCPCLTKKNTILIPRQARHLGRLPLQPWSTDGLRKLTRVLPRCEAVHKKCHPLGPLRFVLGPGAHERLRPRRNRHSQDSVAMSPSHVHKKRIASRRASAAASSDSWYAFPKWGESVSCSAPCEARQEAAGNV